MSLTLEARARAVRLLSCDVDGVLTDGRVYMDDDGRESKAFFALDGFGLRMLAEAGVAVAWITGSTAPAVAHRARLLDVRHVIQNAHDKLTPWRALVESLGFAPAQCAHIGDDLPDLPVMAACGLAATVPHAPLALRSRAHYVTTREGGLGAVRELADLILAAQGKLPDANAARAVPGFLPRSS
jgi:3-deoxy-D-manno-octulosonate 8-phosphate phosphatase (KDO 8-P phosphatase)